MRILAAFDKFRGTLTAREACAAACRAAAGHRCVAQAIADGGEGTLDAFGGPNRWTEVSGPLGDPVRAGWRFDQELAVIEMALASGLALAADAPRPLHASTRGTGELISAALAEGARSILVAVGGSATTDGGWGAVEALGGQRFPVPVTVACDVDTPFVQAARVFGPQKGASPSEVEALTERLSRLASRYKREFGIAVEALPGAGAAGGLAGGLAALGAELATGFGVVAERLNLPRLVGEAEVVLTGEGSFDASSLSGKAVGGVLSLVKAAGKRVIVIAGRVDPAVAGRVESVSLVERFGEEAALARAGRCVADAVAEILSSD